MNKSFKKESGSKGGGIVFTKTKCNICDTILQRWVCTGVNSSSRNGGRRMWERKEEGMS